MTRIHGVFPTVFDLDLVRLWAVADSGAGHVHTHDMANDRPGSDMTNVAAAITPSDGSPPSEITGPEVRPDDVPLRYPVNVLASYHYFRTDDMAKIAAWGLRILADSGAFSAESRGAVIDLEEYADWIKRWQPHLYWAASLDVIGDHQGTLDNWHGLTELGVRTVPTIHYPAEPSLMDVFVSEGADLVGLGGMVPYSSSPDRLMRWSLACFRYARDRHPHVRFHGWGINHKRLLMNLPWFSVDSSGFAASYRYGRIELFNPDTSTMVKIDIKKGARAMAAHNRLLRDHYGIDWRRVLESTPQTRRDVTRCSIRSLQLMEEFLTRRWGDQVSPPASLTTETGPTLHAVLGTPAMQPTRSLNPADTYPEKETQ